MEELVKIHIKETINKETIGKEKSYKKMRHQIGQRFGRKSYLKKMGIREASTTIRRLEMVDIGNNMGKNRKCRRCKEKGTIEHLVECSNKAKEIEEGTSLEWLKETDDIELIRKVNDWLNKEIEIEKEMGKMVDCERKENKRKTTRKEKQNNTENRRRI